MKYIVEMELKHGVIDTNLMETDSLEEAFRELADRWYHLTTSERKNLEHLCILESVNPDEDAEDHYDGDVVIDLTESYRPQERYADDWYGRETDVEYIEECQRYGIPTDDLVFMVGVYGVESISELELV